mmetsp:Transcript_7733/g.14086  ORF Transcript_7733/g.14086 Transcript_7733/m.14086 type:complete len:84 (-) Transcript_7733:13-264(-)
MQAQLRHLFSNFAEALRCITALCSVQNLMGIQQTTLRFKGFILMNVLSKDKIGNLTFRLGVSSFMSFEGKGFGEICVAQLSIK